MKLNVYKNQNEILKTVEVDSYDIMWGTIEDILEILEGIEDVKDKNAILKVVTQNRSKLDDLLLDIFAEGGLTKEDLRMVKVKELVPVFIELFQFVAASFKSKN